MHAGRDLAEPPCIDPWRACHDVGFEDLFSIAESGCSQELVYLHGAIIAPTMTIMALTQPGLDTMRRMYPPFDERRANLLSKPSAKPSGFVSMDKYLKTPRPPTSEDRLLELPPDSWTPELFRQATQEFLAGTGFHRRCSEGR